MVVRCIALQLIFHYYTFLFFPFEYMVFEVTTGARSGWCKANHCKECESWIVYVLFISRNSTIYVGPFRRRSPAISCVSHLFPSIHFELSFISMRHENGSAFPVRQPLNHALLNRLQHEFWERLTG